MPGFALEQDTDDDDEQKRQQALQDAYAAIAAQHDAPPTPDDTNPTADALAQASERAATVGLVGGPTARPTPTQARTLEKIPDQGFVGPGLALLGDLLLNKGRSVGGIVNATLARNEKVGELNRQTDKEQQDMDYKQALIDKARAGDPLAQAKLGQAQQRIDLQGKHIGQEDKRIGLASGAEQRRTDQFNIEHDPKNDSADRVRVALIGAGVDPANVTGRSVAEMKQLGPAYEKEITLFLAPRTAEAAANQGAAVASAENAPLIARAAGESDATQGNKIELANIQAGIAKDRNALEQQDRQGARNDAAAEKFTEKHGADMDQLELIDSIRGAKDGGAVPQSVWERFGTKSSLAARGIKDPARMDVITQKRLLLEDFARNQSGSAISKTEDGKFIQQIGADPTASEEEVNSALRIMRNQAAQHIRGGAAANRDAAERVLTERGFDPTTVLLPRASSGGARAPEAAGGTVGAPGEQVPATLPAGPAVPRTVGHSPPKQAPPEAKVPYHVTKPDGSVVAVSLTAAQAASLTAKGLKVER